MSLQAVLVTAVLCLVLGSAVAAGKGPTVRQVTFVVERQPDGKRYPNPVKESYSLGRSGSFSYGAYFGNMPIELNHNDGVEWASGMMGRAVLATVLRLAIDPTSGMKLLPDDVGAPDNGVGVYLVGLSTDKGDVTYLVQDRGSRAWQLLDGQFRLLVFRFEMATGRPLRPEQLPQRP
jgi:hypothetical protein